MNIMEDKIVIRYNEAGHGRDVSNHAVFTSRIKFNEVFTSRFMSSIVKSAPMSEVEPELFELSKIDGISNLAVYSSSGSLYDLCVSKASSYTWEELTPQIINILNSRYNRLMRERAGQ